MLTSLFPFFHGAAMQTCSAPHQAALVWVQEEPLPSVLLCAGMCTQVGLEMLALNGVTWSPVSIIPPGFASHPGSL